MSEVHLYIPSAVGSRVVFLLDGTQVMDCNSWSLNSTPGFSALPTSEPENLNPESGVTRCGKLA